MSEPARKRPVTLRVVRPGEPEPPDENWRSLTPSERIALVWELTKLCTGWKSEDEPRLQRSVARVIRPPR